MFGHAYFGSAYFGPRYFGVGAGGVVPPPPPTSGTIKQIVMVQQFFFEPGIGFAPQQRASGLWGAQQDVIQRIDGREELTVIPWPTAGKFRNLVISALSAPGADTWVFTLYKNQIATALSVSMTGSTKIASDLTHEISVVAGDQMSIRGTTSNTPVVSWCWEFESNTTNESSYGNLVGVIGNTHTGTTGVFGDGTSAANIGGSICSAFGSLTSTRAKALTAPGLGETYKFTVLLNSVLQDGTGGTVDTVCTISGTNIIANKSYTLPLIPGDIVGMRIVTSAGAPTSNNDIAFGNTFVATTAGQYNTVGAMDQAGTNPQYTWDGSKDSVEANAACIIGPTGIKLTGLRVYQNGGTPGGGSFVYVLRQNSTSPSNQPIVTLTGLQTNGTDSDPNHNITFVGGDVLNLKLTGAMAGNRVNWGFLSSVPSTAPPIGPFSGIYYIHRDKTNDTLYVAITGGTGVIPPITSTSIVPIPNPFFII